MRLEHGSVHIRLVAVVEDAGVEVTITATVVVVVESVVVETAEEEEAVRGEEGAEERDLIDG